MLSHASNAQLLASMLDGGSKFLDKHYIWGWIAGFMWLAVVGVWPDIKKRIPGSWRLTRTTPERMRDIETVQESLKITVAEVESALGQMHKAHEALVERHVTTHEGLVSFMDLYNKSSEINDARIGQLADDRTKMIGDLSELRCRTTLIERTVKAGDNLDKFRAEIGDMLLEAKIAVEMFDEIRSASLQNGIVFKEPFSPWDSASGVPGEDLRLGVIWASFLRRHINHMNQAFYRWPEYLEFFRGCELRLYVPTWSTPPGCDVSGYRCLQLLKTHQLNLQSSFDKAQATDFNEVTDEPNKIIS